MTLNQIKKKLITFFESHSQINTVKYADDYDFSTDSNITYPAIQIDWKLSYPNLPSKSMNHQYTILIVDKINDSAEGIEDEVVSDMLTIADDFITWANIQENFNLNRVGNINEYLDGKLDRVSGVQFQFELSTHRAEKECETPMK